jgi:hypothetical protein
MNLLSSEETTNLYKKSETNPLLIQQHFAEIRSATSEYSAIYTDGSKDGDRVASAAVFGQQVDSILGFLVDECVSMDTYMARNPCENNMLTNSDKAFYKL